MGFRNRSPEQLTDFAVGAKPLQVVNIVGEGRGSHQPALNKMLSTIDPDNFAGDIITNLKQVEGGINHILR